MKRYVKDSGTYREIIESLKDKFPENFGHIFVDEILILIDDDFEIKYPKAKKNQDPSEEEIEKWREKKKRAWKFNLKSLPQVFRDSLDSKKEFLMVVRRSLVSELTEEQNVAYIYSELRKIDSNYKIQKPDLHTFSDLIKLLGTTDWSESFNIPNLLKK
jgi:hypothetical protein